MSVDTGYQTIEHLDFSFAPSCDCFLFAGSACEKAAEWVVELTCFNAHNRRRLWCDFHMKKLTLTCMTCRPEHVEVVVLSAVRIAS